MAASIRTPILYVHHRSELGGAPANLSYLLPELKPQHIEGHIYYHPNDDVGGVFGIGSDVVPNSVDLERFKPGDGEAAKAALGLRRDGPVVSYFGFIYPSKGFREFIAAAARLRDLGVDAQYLIVGGAV